MDNRTGTYYGESDSDEDNDVDNACQLKPSAPTYVVLEPQEVEPNSEWRTSVFTDQFSGVRYSGEDTEAKRDDEITEAMAYSNASYKLCLHDENCFEENEPTTASKGSTNEQYYPDNTRGTSNLFTSEARSYASVDDSAHSCEHNSKSRLKFDTDANLYEPLIQEDLAKYYSIQKPQMQSI